MKEATSHVIAVGALTKGFNECSGWSAPSTCLLDYMVVRGLLFRSMHSVPSKLRWHVQSGPKKLPMTNTPALLSLLNAFGVQTSLLCDLESFQATQVSGIHASRIYRLLDCASTGSRGSGATHRLIDSALEIGLSLGIRDKLVGLGLASVTHDEWS